MASSDTNTNAARVSDEASSTTKTTAAVVAKATYTQDEQYNVKMIGQLLEEAGNAVGKNKPSGTPAEKTAYQKLHNAFRILFSLRGEAFLDAFTIFVKAAVTYKNGILSQTNVNRFIDTFSDKDEAGTFMVFINYLIRFAKSTDKANFASRNDISRLLNRLVNEDLRGLLAHAFNAA